MPELLSLKQKELIQEKLDKIEESIPNWKELFEFKFQEALQYGEIGKAIKMVSENNSLSEEKRQELIKILQEEPSIEELLEISESVDESKIEQVSSVKKIADRILNTNRPLDETIQYIIAAREILPKEDFEKLYEEINQSSDSIKKGLDVYLEAESKNISEKLKQGWENLDKTYFSRLVQIIWGIVNGTITSVDDFLEKQIGGDMDSSTPYSVVVRLVEIPVKITKYIATIPTFFMKYLGNKITGMPEMLVKKIFSIFGNRGKGAKIELKVEELKNIIEKSR